MKRLAGIVMLAATLVSTPAFGDGGDPGDPCSIPKSSRLTRPDPPGTPTPVAIGIYWIDVAAIDDALQEFTADFFVVATWRDPRLAAETRGVSSADCGFGLADLWHPQAHLVNRRNADALLEERVLVDSDGRVEFRQRIFGRFSAPLDLRDFPFDRQRLAITIGSFRYGPEAVTFAVDSRTGKRPSFSIAGWTLGLEEPEVSTEHLQALDQQRSRIDFPLSGRRHSGFYYWKMLLPLSLIVLMAWSVFWIDSSVIPPRISISTSAVFALIAFQLSLGRLLPPVSYLTRADQFLQGSTVLVFLALSEAIFTGRLARRNREKLANRVNRWAVVTYLVFFGLLLIFTTS